MRPRHAQASCSSPAARSSAACCGSTPAGTRVPATPSTWWCSETSCSPSVWTGSVHWYSTVVQRSRVPTAEPQPVRCAVLRDLIYSVKRNHVLQLEGREDFLLEVLPAPAEELVPFVLVGPGQWSKPNRAASTAEAASCCGTNWRGRTSFKLKAGGMHVARHLQGDSQLQPLTVC